MKNVLDFKDRFCLFTTNDRPISPSERRPNTTASSASPPVFIDNIALVKQFILWPGKDGDRIRLQIRADAFNAFNRTNFAVNGSVGNPNFGRATSPQDSPRLITMGARIYF